MPNRQHSRATEHASEQPVRLVAIYADGRVSHRDLSKGRSPWNRGTGWGAHAGAHALPSDSPSPAPEVTKAAKPKDPKKVAAGKARAAQAAGRSGGKFVKGSGKTAKVTVAKSTAGKSTKPKAKTTAKAAAVSADAMVVIAFRGSQAQKDKLAALGGGEWLRARIDAATVRK